MANFRGTLQKQQPPSGERGTPSTERSPQLNTLTDSQVAQGSGIGSVPSSPRAAVPPRTSAADGGNLVFRPKGKGVGALD
jgi:hypothetical protein